MTGQWKKWSGTILVVAGVLVVFFYKGVILEGYERLAYKIAPSSERAMTYADRHFSAEAGWRYDIELAEYFYRQAALRDPSYPYLNHQLARIEFLKGNFNTALLFISREIELRGDATPNSYYVRGLIQGYMGRYDAAARDYEYYLSLLKTPNWAGLMDYAWVLLKAGRNGDAAGVTDEALKIFPGNPWLLNSNAIAYFELGDYERALISVRKASLAVKDVSEQEWLTSYPGNNPTTASAGLFSFKRAVEDNMHMIEVKVASGTVQ